MRFKFLFSLILLLVPIAFAQENILSSKPTYLAGETVQIEVYLPDSIKTLTKSNFEIVDEDYQQTNIGFIFAEISVNHYFIYFDAPLNIAGTFYLKISNYLYRENNQLNEKTIYNKFDIINSSLPIISIKPGLILFYPDRMNPILNIRLKSINYDSEIFIASQDKFIIPIINHFFLPESSVKYISIEIQSSNLTGLTASSLILKYANNSYVIPIWIFKEKQTSQNITLATNITPAQNITPIIPSEQENINMNITPNIIIFQNITKLQNITVNRTIKISKELSFFVYAENKTKLFSISALEIPEKQTLEGEIGFTNTANKTIHNVNILLTGRLSGISRLNQSSFLIIGINETKNLLLVVNEQRRSRLLDYSGNITLSSLEGYKASLPLELKVNKTKPMQEQLFEEKQIESSYIPESSAISSQLPFNFTQAPEEKQKTNYLPAILLIIFIVILLIIYILNKRKTTKITFEAYLKKIKK